MKHYFRVVEKDDQYQFILIPETNIHIAMGYSCLYNTAEECAAGCKKFKEMVKTQPVGTVARIRKINPDCVSYEFFNDKGEVVFSNTYTNNANATNSMRLVIQYINSQIMRY